MVSHRIAHWSPTMNRLLTLAFATSLLTACPGEPAPAACFDAGPSVSAICGDGQVDAPEECDDRNTRNEDGCDSNCRIEHAPACGDGAIDVGEECDDGNRVSGDGCDSECQNEVQPDGDDSCETAGSLDGRANGVIGLPGDVDFYRFTGDPDIWTYIDTDGNSDDDDDKVDTVISVYDADCNLIAENDDVSPGSSADSELILRLPGGGDYFIAVQDYSSWKGDRAERGSEDFTYRLDLSSLSGDQNNITETGGEDAETALPMPVVDGRANLVLGQFTDTVERGVYSFSITQNDKRKFSATLKPVGPYANGSTSVGTVLRLTDSEGNTVARIGHSEAHDEINPGNLPLGAYHLWVERADDQAAGANDFYVVRVRVSEGNAPEQADETNGTVEGAEALSTSSTSGTQRYYLVTNIDVGDLDYFSFDVPASSTVTVVCKSANGGSGLIDMRAEIRTGDDNVVSGAAEDASGLTMRDIGGMTAGTHYLRLSAAGQSPEIAGNWVRCGVHVKPPGN
jgi:cysteine-rich repeat protein